MKRILIILLLSLFVVNNVHQQTIDNDYFFGSLEIDKQHFGYYKIKNVKKKKHFYIIYASKNDLLFKIISDKPQKKTKNNSDEKIKVGNTYFLELDILHPASFYDEAGNRIPSMWNLGIVPTYKDRRINVGKKVHYSLYYALNLSGLQIIPSADAD